MTVLDFDLQSSTRTITISKTISKSLVASSALRVALHDALREAMLRHFVAYEHIIIITMCLFWYLAANKCNNVI